MPSAKPLRSSQDRRNLHAAIVNEETRSTISMVNRQGGVETHNYRIETHTLGTFLVCTFLPFFCLFVCNRPARPVGLTKRDKEQQISCHSICIISICALLRLFSWSVFCSVNIHKKTQTSQYYLLKGRLWWRIIFIVIVAQIISIISIKKSIWTICKWSFTCSLPLYSVCLWLKVAL